MPVNWNWTFFIWDSTCSTVLAFSNIFCFVIHKMFLNWWKVWTAGRPVNSTMQQMCQNRCSMQFSIAEICKTYKHLSALTMPFQICKLMCRLLNWALIANPLLFSPDNAVFMFSKKNLKFWFIWPQNSFSLCLKPFSINFGQKNLVVVLDYVHIWLLFCSMEL